jgi:hypothetical protein
MGLSAIALDVLITADKSTSRLDADHNKRDWRYPAPLPDDVVKLALEIRDAGAHLTLQRLHGQDFDANVNLVTDEEGKMLHEQIIGDKGVLAELDFNLDLWLPPKRIQHPKPAGDFDSGAFEVSNRSHDVDVGHIFGWMVILMNNENAWVIRFLIVLEPEITGVEGQEDAMIRFGMSEVCWIVRTD